jgi:hypothetical protein
MAAYSSPPHHFPFSLFYFPFSAKSFRINTYEKDRGRGVIVNQIPDKGICPEEYHDEGSLFSPDEGFLSRGASRRGTCFLFTLSEGSESRKQMSCLSVLLVE